MTTVTYKTATTFDGYIADEDNSLGWLFSVDHSGDAPEHDTFMRSVGAIVEGSTTYEWLLRETDLLAKPEQWRQFYGDRPTFVFTSRELPVPAGADVRFVNGAVEPALPGIRAAAGERDVWVVGGGDVAGQFADVGALDRIIVTIAPVTLGRGAPLLPRRLHSDRLSLIDVQHRGQFAELTYTLTARS